MNRLKMPCYLCDKYTYNGGKCEGLTQYEIDNCKKPSVTCFVKGGSK